jgi:hypothetical protein
VPVGGGIMQFACTDTLTVTLFGERSERLTASVMSAC